MSEGNQPAPNGAAPAAAPVTIPRAAEPPPKKKPTVDDLLAGFGDEGGDDEGELASDAALAAALDDETTEEATEEPAEEPSEETEAEEPEPDNGLGSESNPYTVKTLPKDRFVKLKVDGEEVTVPMSEMADGYIRQETFHKRVSRADQAADKAVAFAEKAIEEREGLRANFKALMDDPKQLFEFILNRNPGTLEKVAVEYAKLAKQWKEQPGSRERWELERERAKLQSERDALRQRAEEQQRTVAEQQRIEQVRRELAPGFQEGLKLSGFPKPTAELKDMTNILLEQVRRSNGGKPITAEDVKNAVVKAAKIVKAETVEARRPAPAPKSPTAAPKPKAKRDEPAPRRGSVDYFLKNWK